MRPVATSALRQIRVIHQADNAMMLSEREDLKISINVEAVFVRYMVLAVIESHLVISVKNPGH